MKYLIVIEKTKTGFSAYLPDLPGCVTTGKTRREIVKLMREAIPFHLEGLLEEGEHPPRPTSTAALIDVVPPKPEKSLTKEHVFSTGVRRVPTSRFARRVSGEVDSVRKRP